MHRRLLQRIRPTIESLRFGTNVRSFLRTRYPASSPEEIQEPEIDYLAMDPQTDRLVIHEIEILSLSDVGYDIGQHIHSSRDVSIYDGIFNRHCIKFFTIPNEEGEANIGTVGSDVDRFYNDQQQCYVYCRRVCLEGRRFAIKIMALRNTPDYKNSQTEAKVALTLPSHENIVTIYDVIFVSNKRMYMIMEFAEYGTLNIFLTNRQLSEEQAISLMRQLLSGIKFMHDNQVVHYDIHEFNVLVFGVNQTTGEAQVKYVDFGFSVLYGLNVTLAKRPEDIKRLGDLMALIMEKTQFTCVPFENGLYPITERMFDEQYNTIDEVIGEFETLVQNRAQNPLINI